MGYVESVMMPAQEILALMVVGVTMGLFGAGAIRRRRRLPWQQGGPCGCGGASKAANPQVIRIQGRRGTPPKLMVLSQNAKLARTPTLD